MGLHIIDRLMGGDDIQFLSAEVAAAAEKTPVAVADLCGLLCAALDTADLEAMACAQSLYAVLSKRAAFPDWRALTGEAVCRSWLAAVT